jgi:hypothetical protein
MKGSRGSPERRMEGGWREAGGRLEAELKIIQVEFSLGETMRVFYPPKSTSQAQPIILYVLLNPLVGKGTLSSLLPPSSLLIILNMLLDPLSLGTVPSPSFSLVHPLLLLPLFPSPSPSLPLPLLVSPSHHIFQVDWTSINLPISKIVQKISETISEITSPEILTLLNFLTRKMNKGKFISRKKFNTDKIPKISELEDLRKWLEGTYSKNFRHASGINCFNRKHGAAPRPAEIFGTLMHVRVDPDIGIVPELECSGMSPTIRVLFKHFHEPSSLFKDSNGN